MCREMSLCDGTDKISRGGGIVRFNTEIGFSVGFLSAVLMV